MPAHALRRAAAHAQRHTERRRALRADVLSAGRDVEARAGEVEAAQAALDACHAAEQLVVRDRARFEAHARRARERAEEDAADEDAAMRHRRR